MVGCGRNRRFVVGYSGREPAHTTPSSCCWRVAFESYYLRKKLVSFFQSQQHDGVCEITPWVGCGPTNPYRSCHPPPQMQEPAEYPRMRHGALANQGYSTHTTEQ